MGRNACWPNIEISKSHLCISSPKRAVKLGQLGRGIPRMPPRGYLTEFTVLTHCHFPRIVEKNILRCTCDESK